MMELDKFISKTLNEIKKGASKSEDQKIKFSITQHPIEFDLSVSTNEEKDGNLNAKLYVINSNLQNKSTNSTEQRVKFKIQAWESPSTDDTLI